jgi:predicted amidophosphoribosyltransferase
MNELRYRPLCHDCGLRWYTVTRREWLVYCDQCGRHLDHFVAEAPEPEKP